MEWLMAIMGIASLVGSLVYGSQQKKKEEQTEQYNKDLNQTLMDREDNAWQRAVEDRSKSGLSVAGLSQGAGSGGTVSQLQSPQGNAVMANLMQNISGQSFGLASSAYENRKNRQLQKDNFESELRLKKEQLDTDILNAQYQRMKILAEIQGLNDESVRQESIYKHNMDIARGNSKNPLARVYGSQPSEIESLLRALVNNKNDIEDNIYNELHPEQKAMNDNVGSAMLSGATKTSSKSAPTTIKNDKNNLPQSFLSTDPDLSHLIPWSYSKNGYDKTITFKNTFTNKTIEVLVTTSQYDYWKNKIENYDYSGWKD